MARMYGACAAGDMRRMVICSGWPGAMLRKVHTVPFNDVIAAIRQHWRTVLLLLVLSLLMLVGMLGA